ncbi:MAG: hypothetical protein ACK4MF_08745 [Hyphomicrobiaceae bacterium]
MLDEQAIAYLPAALLAVGMAVVFVRLLGAPRRRGTRHRSEGHNSRDCGGGSSGGSSTKIRKDGEGDGDGGGTDSGGDGGGGGGD